MTAAHLELGRQRPPAHDDRIAGKLDNVAMERLHFGDHLLEIGIDERLEELCAERAPRR